MVSYYFLVILRITVPRIATINPKYPECLDDSPTAIHDGLKTGQEYHKNDSKFDKIVSTPDCFEHVQNSLEGMPMFQDLSIIKRNTRLQ
jgi:hypothetical protein